MAHMILRGTRAVRIKANGSGLESTSNFYPSGCSTWGDCWNSNYGTMVDLIDCGDEKIIALTTSHEVELFWSCNGCSQRSVNNR